MKNNTKIRLHLSKQLFESLTKQVIAEAKTKHYGAGMEEVKAPKKAHKKEKVEETTEMVDENMVSDLADKLKTLPADKLKQLKAYWDQNLSPEAVKSGKVKGVTLPSNIGEMETEVAEDVNPMHYVTDPALVLLTQIIGSGLLGTAVTAIVKGIIDDVKKGKKTPKQAAKEAGEVIKKGS